MQANKIFTRRLIILLFVILIWFGLGNVAFSFSLGDVVSGAIALVISLAILGAMLEGRLIRLLEGRPLPRAGLFTFSISLAAAVVMYDGIQSLRFSDTTLLGAIYLPGWISIVSALGKFLLAAALLWELRKLIFSKA